MSIERINLIGVPVDVCEPENLEAEINGTFGKGK